MRQPQILRILSGLSNKCLQRFIGGMDISIKNATSLIADMNSNDKQEVAAYDLLLLPEIFFAFRLIMA